MRSRARTSDGIYKVEIVTLPRSGGRTLPAQILVQEVPPWRMMATLNFARRGSRDVFRVVNERSLRNDLPSAMVTLCTYTLGALAYLIRE